MHPATAQCVNEGGGSSSQGLPLTGRHFGNGTPGEDQSAQKLRIMQRLPSDPANRLQREGESRFQDLTRLHIAARLHVLAELDGIAFELRITQRGESRGDTTDSGDQRSQLGRSPGASLDFRSVWGLLRQHHSCHSGRYDCASTGLRAS